MPEDTDPELLLIPEVATYLRCSEGHVRHLIARGELPAVKLGALVRIRRADLEKITSRFVTP